MLSIQHQLLLLFVKYALVIIEEKSGMKIIFVRFEYLGTQISISTWDRQIVLEEIGS